MLQMLYSKHLIDISYTITFLQSLIPYCEYDDNTKLVRKALYRQRSWRPLPRISKQQTPLLQHAIYTTHLKGKLKTHVAARQ